MELLLLMSLNSLLLFNAYITSAELNYLVLHAEISIEDNAEGHLTELLQTFPNVTHGSESIREIKTTRDCQEVDKTNKCECTKDFKEDEDNDNLCIPEKRVSVKGEIVLKDEPYDNKLTDRASEEFKKLSKKLTQELSKCYSRLKWFRSLNILHFSKGSVIVVFEMTFDTNEGLEKIDEITASLQNTSGETTLVTQGFVTITAPDYTVKFNTSQNLSCQTSQPIGQFTWFLVSSKDENKIEIHGGTEVKFIDKPPNTQIRLEYTSYIWRGKYICEFQQKSVKHQAHAFLDVALLPVIDIYTKPQFPNCKEADEVNVKVTCAITNTTEPYTVTWEDPDFIPEDIKYERGDRLYRIRKTIKCKEENYEVSCNFTNRLNQSQLQKVTIPVIKTNSPVCNKDGDWPQAKAGHTATLQCEGDQRGERTRKCSKDKTWATEINKCVNIDLQDIAGKAENLERGLGKFTEVASKVFEDMKASTQRSINSAANIDTSVSIFGTMSRVSVAKNESLGETVLPDFLISASNIINDSLKDSWNPDLAADYLSNVNNLLDQSYPSEDFEDKKAPNIKLKLYDRSNRGKVYNVSMDFDMDAGSSANVTGFRTLGEYLPLQIDNTTTELEPRATVLRVNAPSAKKVTFKFNNVNRTKNHELHCVVWLPDKKTWSSKDCKWGGAGSDECECKLNSGVRSDRYKGGSFTVLMSKHPVNIPYVDDLTTIGLGVSIVSLILCLLIEFAVWNSVVKSTISHFRHTAVVNISLCLLLADSSFMATAFPNSHPSQWCRWLVVMKHYCFLAMFFWMLCLSLVLLHSLIFVFQRLRKKIYLGMSFSVGYVCPMIIVVLTVIAFDNGEADSYYLTETCWLKYDGLFKGSFYAFVMPVGIIVAINVFSMLVVIVRLLKPSVSEGHSQDDKDVIRGILKAVIFLTPIFGVTWIFGFFVLATDHTITPLSEIVNYTFTVCNAFQGLFILLTACLGEKKVRETLVQKFCHHSKVYTTSRGERSNSNSNSKTSTESSIKKK